MLFTVGLLAVLGCTLADISDTNPAYHSCLCVNTNNVNVRDDAGTGSNIVGTVNSGDCFLYSGLKLTDDQYSWFSIAYYSGQDEPRAWVAGVYLNLMGDSSHESCSGGGGGCTGDGWVDYQGFTVSDATLRDKLEQVADYFCSRLWVTSGDRNGGGTSLHDVGRAADFWIDGYDGANDGEPLFCDIKNSGLVDVDYEVIWHGRYTCTGGEHIHLGRYADGLPSCYMIEGSRSDFGDYCQYICDSGITC